MTGIEKVYFQPGETPPFPGYEAWLEEVKRAPIWQAKAPRPYAPDVRDGLGKELFPPPPPRSNLEPSSSNHYGRDIAVAALDFIWEARPDLVWETLWWLQYLQDDIEEGDRLTEDCRYSSMFRYAILYQLKKEFSQLSNSACFDIILEIQNQLWVVFDCLPLHMRRAPWVGADGFVLF